MLIYYLSIVLIFNLFSCNNTQEKNIELALKQYDIWRINQLNTEKYFDKCPPEEEIDTEFTRYSLPKLEDLGNENGYVSIDTNGIDFNKDKKIDFLFKLRPYDCAEGAGLLSMHPPIHLLVVSNENGYELNDTIVNDVNTKIRELINYSFDSYADWIYLDTLYMKGENVFGKGTFYVWLDDDSSCCPSITADYKTLLPNDKDKGYIDIEGKYKPEGEDEIEKEFSKRIEF